MTIHHLRIFQTVCRNESMTKAAQELNMSQPAVSLSVSELEAFYQAKVFDRNKRKLQLTEPGKVLLGYANTILSQYDEAALTLREGTIFHSCSIGLNVSTAESEADRIIALLKKKIPDIDLHVLVHNSSEILDMLASNRIDLAIVDELQDEDPFDFSLYRREAMLAFASAQCTMKTTMSREEFLQYPLLLREKGSGNRRCMDQYFAEDEPVPFMESASELSLIRTAKAGFGVVFLPASMEEEITKEQLLHTITFKGKAPVRSYYLVNVRNRYQTKTVAEVRRILAGEKKS